VRSVYSETTHGPPERLINKKRLIGASGPSADSDVFPIVLGNLFQLPMREFGPGPYPQPGAVVPPHPRWCQLLCPRPPPSWPPRASANPGNATATNVANELNINRRFLRLKRL
jgi:hypothetical protein